MTTKLPRIDGVTIAPPTSLVVEWSDEGLDTIDLAGWIATGDDLLAPLRDYAMFATARPGLYGASVVWGDEEGDLVIDAHHLRLLLEGCGSVAGRDRVVEQRGRRLPRDLAEHLECLQGRRPDPDADRHGVPRRPA